MSHQFFRRLALLTAALVYLLVILGGAVSAWDAGLACPDWPLCHGKLVPPMDPQVFLEWFHRLVGGGVSLLIVWTGMLAWRSQRRRRGVAAAGLLLIGLLAVQVVLGGLTVLWLLPPLIITLHLGVALSILSILLLFALLPAEPAVIQRRQAAEPSDADRTFRRTAHAALAATFVVMLLGAYTSKSGAGLGCPDWPLCHGAWIPPLDSHLVATQFAHRLAVLGAGFAIVCTAVAAWYTQRHRPRVLAAAIAAALLLVVQVILGALMVLYVLPPALITAHLGTATALLVCLLYACVCARAPAAAPDQAAPDQAAGAVAQGNLEVTL